MIKTSILFHFGYYLYRHISGQSLQPYPTASKGYNLSIYFDWYKYLQKENKLQCWLNLNSAISFYKTIAKLYWLLHFDTFMSNIVCQKKELKFSAQKWLIKCRWNWPLNELWKRNVEKSEKKLDQMTKKKFGHYKFYRYYVTTTATVTSSTTATTCAYWYFVCVKGNLSYFSVWEFHWNVGRKTVIS